jgi:hypothetical protein
MRAGRRGVTLVEVIIVVGLAAVVCGALVWLMVTAFRINRTAQLEMDLTSESLRVFRRTSRDVTASRGLVRFTPAGAGAEADALQMKGGNLVLWHRESDGTVWRTVYGTGNHPKVVEEQVCSGCTYFHVVALETGVHVALELERGGTQGASYGTDTSARRLELSTVVVPRGW